MFIPADEITQTIRMILKEHLDIRTVTMGINLLDCASDDLGTKCCKIYDKITEKAGSLVKTACEIEAEYGIPEYDIDIITSSKKMADIFEETIALGCRPKEVSNWLMVETMRLLKDEDMDADDIRFSPAHLAALIGLVEEGKINRTVAKEVFEVLFREDTDPVSYVEEKGLSMVQDEGALRSTIEEIVKNNPQSVEDYKNGKKKAIGFLVGQTMKAMKGKADPAMVNRILMQILS